MTTNTTGEDRSVSGEQNGGQQAVEHLAELFRDWLKSSGIDFWDEANAPEELAHIAMRFRTTAPSTAAGEREAEAQAISEWLMQEAASRREMGEAFGRHALEGFTSDAAVLERAAELIREVNAALVEALERAVLDLETTRTNAMVEINKKNDRWDGVPDLLKERIDGYRAALSRATGEQA